MKKTILLIFLTVTSTLLAQDYKTKWEKVEEYENLGKIKSAAKVVDKIYSKAVRDNSQPHIIKSFIYSLRYIHVLEEDAQTMIVGSLKNEIAKAPPATKAVLQLFYAKSLQEYLQQNHYRIERRTSTELIGENFHTWSATDFAATIDSLFAEMLSQPEILKSTPLQDYESIFEISSSSHEADLYSFMLLENIAYHQSSIGRVYRVRTGYAGYGEVLYSSSETFTKWDVSAVSETKVRMILEFYQQLEKHKPTGSNIIARIDFVRNYLLNDNDRYVRSLTQLQKHTSSVETLQKILYKKGFTYRSMANKNAAVNYNQMALSALDSVLAYKEETNTHHLAVTMKREILQKRLSMEMEQFTYPGQNNRARIEFQNINCIEMRYYEIDQKEMGMLSTKKRDSIQSAIVASRLPIVSATHLLPKIDDYFARTTDILLPNLQLGNYLVVAKNLDIDNTDSKQAYTAITVTNLAVAAYKKEKNSYYQVVDRKFGFPIPDALVSVKGSSQITNSEGIAILSETPYNYNNRVTIAKDQDTIIMWNNARELAAEDDDEDFRSKVTLYLDRAIYRPAQKVFFKIIAAKKIKFKPEILPQMQFKLQVSGPDDNEVFATHFTTNDFGSYSGEFTLPENLTGRFYISVEEPDNIEVDQENDEHPFWDYTDLEDAHLFFDVEEYKRPKFEVTFEPINGEQAVNEKVSVNGKATAFAGSTITNAKVNYRVQRNVFNKLAHYPINEETISSGTTETDSEGKFTVEFIAETPNNVEQQELPVFQYVVIADVTDINGETRSASTSLKLGYHSLQLELDIATSLQMNTPVEATLKSTTLNNEFLPAIGELTLKFIDWETAFKKRTFGEPDIDPFTKIEFNRLFPYEQYKISTSDEDSGELIFTKKINTAIDKTSELNFKKPGIYRLIFTAVDSKGNQVSTDKIIEVESPAGKMSQLLTLKQLNSNPKKDGFVKLAVTSQVKSLHLFYASRTDTDLTNGHVFLDNFKTTINIPINGEYTGPLILSVNTIFDNEFFAESIEIMMKSDIVPQFEIETFRNKIEPGTAEKWTFKLVGTQAESEVLASMYDASLDQFTMENWDNPDFDLRSSYPSHREFLGNYPASLYVHFYTTYTVPAYTNENDKLRTFGFSLTEIPKWNVDYVAKTRKKIKIPRNASLIRGVVSDHTGPIPGANVVIQGTMRGVQTDIDGFYEIAAAPGEVLVFSYVGMTDFSATVGALKIINATLDEGVILGEVVVTALGIRRKADKITSSYHVVSNEELAQTGNQNAVQLLQGKVAGLQINTTNSTASAVVFRGARSLTGNNQALVVIDGKIASLQTLEQIPATSIQSIYSLNGSEGAAIYGSDGVNGVIILTTKKAAHQLISIQARNNLAETAFFFPDLKTDAAGRVSFSFTSPEALTQWKLRMLSHTKHLDMAYLEKMVVTQKELMIIPNLSRFVREKDTIVISTKISNLTSTKKLGMASLQLFDASTMQAIDAETSNLQAIKSFAVEANGNSSVSWKISIPDGLHGLQYRIVAKSGASSDGEEALIPVLTNDMLVTETIPIWVGENSKKEYEFTNLRDNTSATLRNHQFTFEYTSNPTWLAIQALPYLIEYEHECSEQTFARYYANVLAAKIITDNPKIASIFDEWRKENPVAKLERNKELKSILLAETPWANDARSDAEKKQALALLFDLASMKESEQQILRKLGELQTSSGAFAWFKGGTENEYITRHIVAGLGHLGKLTSDTEQFAGILQSALSYLDGKFIEGRQKATSNDTPDVLHYLYMRSFFVNDYPISEKLNPSVKITLESVANNWLNLPLYQKAMAALALQRFGKKTEAQKIIESFKETASNNEDWGMYWIENKPGYYWYQSPIETQALIMESFGEVTNDTKSIDAMKVWLLKNKQNKNWPTTKSTTEAIYALLTQGTDWNNVKHDSKINIGDQTLLTKKLAQTEKEAETGYIHLTWNQHEITNAMSKISVQNNSEVPTFGGVYWQYFEDLDQIKTSDKSVMNVSKELYLKKNTSTGQQLQKIESGNVLRLGDLVTVRLIVTAKDDMEFVHLKDMRASCFEPVDVLSKYKWQSGIGYYMSTKDVATHFFFDSIRKGTYVFEYDIRVNNAGDFANGITTIQSMYAPEFSSHSKGIRVTVAQ